MIYPSTIGFLRFDDSYRRSGQPAGPQDTLRYAGERDGGLGPPCPKVGNPQGPQDTLRYAGERDGGLGPPCPKVGNPQGPQDTLRYATRTLTRPISI